MVSRHRADLTPAQLSCVLRSCGIVTSSRAAPAALEAPPNSSPKGDLTEEVARALQLGALVARHELLQVRVPDGLHVGKFEERHPALIHLRTPRSAPLPARRLEPPRTRADSV